MRASYPGKIESQTKPSIFEVSIINLYGKCNSILLLSIWLSKFFSSEATKLRWQIQLEKSSRHWSSFLYNKINMIWLIWLKNKCPSTFSIKHNAHGSIFRKLCFIHYCVSCKYNFLMEISSRKQAKATHVRVIKPLIFPLIITDGSFFISKTVPNVTQLRQLQNSISDNITCICNLNNIINLNWFFTTNSNVKVPSILSIYWKNSH